MNKKLIPLALFILITGTILISQTVDAQIEPQVLVDNHTHDAVLGLTPIQMTIAITAIGIVGRTVISVARNPKSFSWAIFGQSIFIGFLSSIALVANTVEHIPLGISDLALFTMLIGEIMLVAGIDKGVRDAQNFLAPAVVSKIKTKSTEPVPMTRPRHEREARIAEAAEEQASLMNELEEELQENDDEDLPPGKDGA